MLNESLLSGNNRRKLSLSEKSSINSAHSEVWRGNLFQVQSGVPFKDMTATI